MPRWVKWGLIALAAWTVFTQPAKAAAATGEVFGKLGDAADSAVTFLTTLVS